MAEVHHSLFSRVLRLLVVAVLLWTGAGHASIAGAEDLDSTIGHLIQYVEQSDVRFERNFTSHNAREAAEHMTNKYNHFRDEIDTPEKFIELCATRSLVTGREYQVVTVEGETLPAGQWLTVELQRYRAQHGVE